MSNHLKLISSKSEFLWCITFRHLHLLDGSTFALSDAEIWPAEAFCNIGVPFDICMTKSAHVVQLVWGCFYYLSCIINIRGFSPTLATVTLVSSLMVTRVDYCNGLHFSARVDTVGAQLCCQGSSVVRHHSIMSLNCYLIAFTGCVFIRRSPTNGS